jgi:hypothetical protein
MMKLLPSVSIKTELLNLLSFLSVERQTLQLQPIIGTPSEVPVPRKVIFISFGKIFTKI